MLQSLSYKVSWCIGDPIMILSKFPKNVNENFNLNHSQTKFEENYARSFYRSKISEKNLLLHTLPFKTELCFL